MAGNRSSRKWGRWIKTHRFESAIIVAAIVAIPLTAFTPVKMTIDIEYVYGHYVRIIIDGKVMDDYYLPWERIDGIAMVTDTRTQLSFYVGVGSHEVTILNDWVIDFQRTVIVWPFVGGSDTYNLNVSV